MTAPLLFEGNLGMLNCQGQVFLREVEHVEDHILIASVLAVVDGVHHLDKSVPLIP